MRAVPSADSPIAGWLKQKTSKLHQRLHRSPLFADLQQGRSTEADAGQLMELMWWWQQSGHRWLRQQLGQHEPPGLKMLSYWIDNTGPDVCQIEAVPWFPPNVPLCQALGWGYVISGRAIWVYRRRDYRQARYHSDPHPPAKNVSGPVSVGPGGGLFHSDECRTNP